MMERIPFDPDLDGPEYFDRLEADDEIEREYLESALERAEAKHRKSMMVATVAVIFACAALGKLAG